MKRIILFSVILVMADCILFGINFNFDRKTTPESYQIKGCLEKLKCKIKCGKIPIFHCKVNQTTLEGANPAKKDLCKVVKGGRTIEFRRSYESVQPFFVDEESDAMKAYRKNPYRHVVHFTDAKELCKVTNELTPESFGVKECMSRLGCFHTCGNNSKFNCLVSKITWDGENKDDMCKIVKGGKVLEYHYSYRMAKPLIEDENSPVLKAYRNNPYKSVVYSISIRELCQGYFETEK